MWAARLLITLAVIYPVNGRKLPEEDLTVPGIIKYMGYPVETHEVLTDDGYYLTLHRIPHGRLNSITTNNENNVRPVMFLQHGLLCSSSNWVVNLQHQSLAFILADAGYDVWMGNVRGNTYSKKHKILNTTDDSFWDFSFHEMGKYDLPAMIDFVLQTTNQPQLYYVGHSQGTTIVFAGLSENEGLQKKIKIFFALAPVARERYLYTPIKDFAPFQGAIKLAFEVLNVNEFLPSTKAITFIGEVICPLDESICRGMLSLIAGYDKKNLNETRLPIYIAHTPAGTSVKNIYHFAQLVNSQVFQKYDYGWFSNLIKYNSLRPPVYPIQNMKVPTVIFSGSEDWLAAPEDVKWISEQIPNLKETHEIEGYNHWDFVWGMSTANDVYKKIINIAQNFSSAESNESEIRMH